MALTVLSFIFATLFSVVVMAINVINENPFKLTLRGRRVLFAFAFVIGIVISQYVFHAEWNCDLRSNSTTTTCTLTWK